MLYPFNSIQLVKCNAFLMEKESFKETTFVLKLIF